ncbi:MAG TPA: polyprenol monophosphomannose synthase [Terracidiphilus sp.]|nr:polyprenol monophosphomannose synthase [Terracidiphilus sp.]
MENMESACRTRDGTGTSNQETLALIIPTLNEAENIRGVLNRTRSVLDPVGINYEILVVDDDSSDGTGEIVSAISLEDPRVRLIVRKGAKGVAGATLLGWENTDASIVGAMDADLQHPPELLPALVSAILAGHDVAIGSRYAAGGSLGNWNLPRKLLSNAALWVAMPVQRKQIRAKDPTAGFFLVRRECIDQIQFQRTGFKLLLDVLVRGRIRSIKEIPYTFESRHHGASKATFKVACEYGGLLVRLYWERFGFHRRGVQPESAS